MQIRMRSSGSCRSRYREILMFGAAKKRSRIGSKNSVLAASDQAGRIQKPGRQSFLMFQLKKSRASHLKLAFFAHDPRLGMEISKRLYSPERDTHVFAPNKFKRGIFLRIYF